LLGLVSSLIWWVFVKNPLDICAQRRELFSCEDAIENDVAI
jgi:hypothetical protein